MKFLRENGLSVALALLFILFMAGQTVSGYFQHNQDLVDHYLPVLGVMEYLLSGHFIEATAENWESEFLQMFLFIVLTTWLHQRGSSESEAPGSPKEQALPGLRGKLYQNSLSLVFLLAYAGSVALHAYGGLLMHNQQQEQHGGSTSSLLDYLLSSQFWFESFQNYQSEFLALLSIVLLSIWFRQKDSAQSKALRTSNTDNE
jgi:hypothetical protein